MPKHDPSEKTKSEILQTAVRMFQERGWTSVKIEDIVNEVGVTRGAFYHYFKSREELIVAAMDVIYNEHNSFVLADQEEGLNTLEKLHFALTHNINFNAENTEMRMMFEKALKNPEVFRSEFYSMMNTTAPFLERLLKEGNKEGLISVAYPKQMAQVMTLLTNMWLNPMILPASEQEMNDRVSFLKELGDSLGIPVIDDETKALMIRFFEK